MSASAAPRILLRQPGRLVWRQSTRRFQSTSEKASEVASNASSKAKEAAANPQSKASDGLSRVTSSAGPAISGAAKKVGGALGGVGGPVGRLVRLVDSTLPQVVYYSRVGLELSKLVFQGQRMSPPSLQSFQSYLEPLLGAFRNPSTLLRSAPSASSINPESVLSRVRNVNRAQLAAGSVVLAEVLGFFTVGEMIGRMKLIGYRGEVHHGH